MLIGAYLALKSPPVQTWVAQQLAGELSERTGHEIRIEKVNIEWFRTAALQGLYVEDHRADTLLYARELKGKFSLFSFWGRQVHLKRLELNEPHFELHKYQTDSVFNIKLFIDQFIPEESVNDPWTFDGDRLLIRNGDFVLRDHHKEREKKGVDFSDLRLQGLDIDLQGVEHNEDSVGGHLHTLRFEEQHSGFVLDSLGGEASYDPQGMHLKGLQLLTPGSELNGSVEFAYETPASMKEWVRKVDMRVDLTPDSKLATRDLAAFVEELQGMESVIGIGARVRGTVSELKLKDLLLAYSPNTYFKGGLELTGLPRIENTFITMEAEDLNARKKELEQIPLPPFQKGNTLSLPPQLSRLGDMNFSGSFTGFINDFVAYGTLNTDLGQLRSDLEFARDTSSGHLRYDGKIQTRSFDVGSYYKDPDMGRIDARLELKGSGFGIERAKTRMNGTIDRFEYKEYPYQDLNVIGEFANQRFKGLLEGGDPNFDFAFNGMIDLRKEVPEYSFSMDIKKMRPVALNLMERDSSMFIRSRLEFDGKGADLQDLEGELAAYETVYKESGKTYELGDIVLRAEDHPKGKRFDLSSPIAKASITGRFDPLHLPAHFEEQAYKVLPSLFEDRPGEHQSEQNFVFDLRIRQIPPFLDEFFPKWQIADNTVLNGSFYSDVEEFQMDLFSPSIEYREQGFSGLQLKLHRRQDIMELDLTSDTLHMNDSLYLEEFVFRDKFYEDHMQVQTRWADGVPRSSGSLEFITRVEGMERFEFESLSSNLRLAGENWRIEPDGIVRIAPSSYAFRDVRFGDGKRWFNVEGDVSKNPKDELRVAFNDFELGILSPFVPPELDPKGQINGKAEFSDLFGDPVFTSDLTVDSTELAGHGLGTLSLMSNWMGGEKALKIQGSLEKDSIENLGIDGKYFHGREEELDVDIRTDGFDIGILNGFLEGGISGIQGKVSGPLQLKGTLKQPYLTGSVMANDVGLRVDELNVRYGFEEERIVFYEDMIGFDHIPFHYIDPRTGEKVKGRGRATGTLIHDHFQGWNFNIFVEMDRLLAMSLEKGMNDLYYGRAFGSGDVEISGYPGTLSIDVDAKTEKGTDLKLPLAGGQDVQMESFVTFVDHESESERSDPPDLEGVDMNFDLEVTPDAKVSIIFDEKIGDVMKGRGKGNIKMEVNTSGKFDMFGRYEIHEGDYLFTMQNVINKRFTVQKGGTIEWFGDPYKAIIDLDAVYNLRTSIYSLIQEEAYKRRIPVGLVMNLSQDLMNPEIAFNIRFPSLSEDVRSMAHSRIESVNKQAFALLVLNRFIDEQGQRGGEGTQGVGTNTSSELLSNQLSNWLSSISEEFDMGVNYRPGDEVTDEEIAVALSTQLFNERVSVSGNFGVQNRSELSQEQGREQNSLVGDFTLQYDITQDGKFRLKVFNESNEDRISQLQNSDYTQGVGLHYQEEFDTAAELLNRVGQLFRRKEKEKGKGKEEEVEEEEKGEEESEETPGH